MTTDNPKGQTSGEEAIASLRQQESELDARVEEAKRQALSEGKEPFDLDRFEAIYTSPHATPSIESRGKNEFTLMKENTTSGAAVEQRRCRSSPTPCAITTTMTGPNRLAAMSSKEGIEMLRRRQAEIVRRLVRA